MAQAEGRKKNDWDEYTARVWTRLAPEERRALAVDPLSSQIFAARADDAKKERKLYSNKERVAIMQTERVLRGQKQTKIASVAATAAGPASTAATTPISRCTVDPSLLLMRDNCRKLQKERTAAIAANKLQQDLTDALAKAALKEQELRTTFDSITDGFGTSRPTSIVFGDCGSENPTTLLYDIHGNIEKGASPPRWLEVESSGTVLFFTGFQRKCREFYHP